MKVVIQIQVKPLEQISFGSPLTPWLKEEFPEVVLLDADNLSESLVIDQEVKMLKEANQVVLLLDMIPNAKPGKVVRILETLFRNQEKSVLVHLTGANESIHKMMKISRLEYHQNCDEAALKSLISDFLAQAI